MPAQNGTSSEMLDVDSKQSHHQQQQQQQSETVEVEEVQIKNEVEVESIEGEENKEVKEVDTNGKQEEEMKEVNEEEEMKEVKGEAEEEKTETEVVDYEKEEDEEVEEESEGGGNGEESEGGDTGEESEEEEGGGENSDGRHSATDGTDDEENDDDDRYVHVNLAKVRKEVECPICLGIIRNTRTVMECLHRFCRDCIHKSMRMGNNECPTCRTHCASRRSLRDDLRYDAIIAACFPDIDKYEEQEFAFQEKDEARNKQIQASIAQTVQKQSDALTKRRSTTRTPAAASLRKSRRRKSRNSRGIEIQGSDDDEVNGNVCERGSSSNDERSVDARQKRQKLLSGTWSSQPFSAAAKADGSVDEDDDSEVSRDIPGITPVNIGNPEVPSWGKGGVRSHTRYGSLSGSIGKNLRRINKLANHLRNLDENDNELDVHLILISFDEQRIPSLEEPYLCCRPTLSIRQLCQFISLQTHVQAEDIDIFVVKHPVFTKDDESGSSVNSSAATNYVLPKIDLSKETPQILDREETLAEQQEHYTATGGQMVMAYMKRAKLEF